MRIFNKDEYHLEFEQLSDKEFLFRQLLFARQTSHSDSRPMLAIFSHLLAWIEAGYSWEIQVIQVRVCQRD